MRKFLAILFISFALTALQGGKIAAYLLCKWQMEVVQQQANCDCEKHLNGLDEQTTSSQFPGVLKEKPAEHFVNAFCSFDHSRPEAGIMFFAGFDSPLTEGFVFSFFRPPSIM